MRPCYICTKPAIGEAYNLKWQEWQPLCREHYDRENPDKWEAYKEEDNERKNDNIQTGSKGDG